MGFFWRGLDAQLLDDGRQWLGEVLVLALSEAVAGHVHAAPESSSVGVESPELRALALCQQRLCAGKAQLVERARDRGPVEPGQPPRGECAHAAWGLQTLHGR